jgi:hypothetical protein
MAIHYFSKAGEQALDNFANREAVTFFSECLELQKKKLGMEHCQEYLEFIFYLQQIICFEIKGLLNRNYHQRHPNKVQKKVRSL